MERYTDLSPGDFYRWIFSLGDVDATTTTDLQRNKKMHFKWALLQYPHAIINYDHIYCYVIDFLIDIMYLSTTGYFSYMLNAQSYNINP